MNNENVFIPCIMTVSVCMCRILHECFPFFSSSIMVHLILNGNAYPFDTKGELMRFKHLPPSEIWKRPKESISNMKWNTFNICHDFCAFESLSTSSGIWWFLWNANEIPRRVDRCKFMCSCLVTYKHSISFSVDFCVGNFLWGVVRR